MAKSSIGQFISALRKANGMTQQEMADRLGVSNKAVSRWERDECAPDISLIPAIAEMFGVTCDELLKGRRILEAAPQEKKEPKVERQVKNLVNRTLSSFKTLIWISLTISAIGLVCMFGISYGFYYPVIGFSVMLLFEVCACVVAILAVSRTKDVKTHNELFEEADDTLVDRFDNTLGAYSFIAFFAILAVIILSLPFILFTTDFVKSVMAISSYFVMFFGGNALILTLIFLKCRSPYMEWIAGKRLNEKVNSANTSKVRTMNVIQVGLTILAGFLFVVADYFEWNPTGKFSLFDVVVLVGLICLVASIVYFFVFLAKHKEERREFILPGIRNICLIPSALIVSEMHYMVWYGGEDEYIVSEFERYEVWQMEYFWYAIALAVFVYVVFSLIDVLIKRKSR